MVLFLAGSHEPMQNSNLKTSSTSFVEKLEFRSELEQLRRVEKSVEKRSNRLRRAEKSQGTQVRTCENGWDDKR
jgi:phage gp37-like protein